MSWWGERLWLNDLDAPGHMDAPPCAAAEVALKPRERSSPRPETAEGVADQSTKAPESEGNLLVVATTEAVFFRILLESGRSE